MDLLELLGGLRTIGAEEIEDFAQAKTSALAYAYKRLREVNADAQFDDFIRSVPEGLLSTYFASDGIDHHYTSMLAILCAGKPYTDVFLLASLNFLLQELTYQGRYLGVSWPEVFVFAQGDSWIGEAALANADRIAGFSLVAQPDSLEDLVTKMAVATLNFGTMSYLPIAALPNVIPQPPARYIGCLAFVREFHEKFCLKDINEVIRTLHHSLNSETHYLFCGNLIEVQAVFDAFDFKYAPYLVYKAYNVNHEGLSYPKAIVVVSGLVTPPDAPDDSMNDRQSYTVLSHDDVLSGLADGVESIAAHPTEIVCQRVPSMVLSSIPLPARQLATIINSLPIHHNVLRIPSGIIISSITPYNCTYIMSTSQNHILEHIVVPTLYQNSPYSKVDADGVVEVVRRPRVYINGPAMPLAFSPAVLDYHSHFLLQCFPRLSVAKVLGLTKCKFLVPPGIKKYQLRMMEMAGVEASDIVKMDEACDYVCDQLYVPTVNPAIMTPFYASIYDELVARRAKSDKRPDRRIIISRGARATWRNMVNYDAMCDILVRDHGFEVVAPDKLSIEDEIDLFQSCSIVVGAEGAGLYNCCFMQADTDVVCLADQDYVMYVVGGIAKHRGFDVSFVFGESFQADRDLSRRSGHADFVVDPLRVSLCVGDIISRKSTFEDAAPDA